MEHLKRIKNHTFNEALLHNRLKWLNGSKYFKEKFEVRKLSDEEVKQYETWHDGSYPLYELIMGDRKPFYIPAHPKRIMDFIRGIMFCAEWVQKGNYFTDHLYKASDVFELLNNYEKEIER